VEHAWTLEFVPRWSVDPVLVGAGLGPGQFSVELSLLEAQYAFLRARLLSTWLNPAAGNAHTGPDVRATSLLPAGLTLPPYRVEWLQPYYLYHWSMNGHELGLEIGPGSNTNLGLRLGAVTSASLTAVTLGASLGGMSNETSNTLGDYPWPGDQGGFRLGFGAIGGSVGSRHGPGIRASVLDLQAGYLLTSLFDFDVSAGGTVNYDSLLPVGLALPPAVERWLTPYYKFHWYPAFAASRNGVSDIRSLVGMHTVGLGIIVPEDLPITPAFRMSLTTGVNHEGDALLLLGLDIESRYLLALFTM